MIAQAQSFQGSHCSTIGHEWVSDGYDKNGQPLKHCARCAVGYFEAQAACAQEAEICRTLGHDWQPTENGERCDTCSAHRAIPHGPIDGWTMVGILIMSASLGILGIIGIAYLLGIL